MVLEFNMDMYDMQDKMRNIPFGMSVYQITHFTEQLTPERQYRHCLLQIDKKLRSLKECEFRRKRIEIDLQELNDKFSTLTGYEKERIKIDIEEKEYNLELEKKLIEDAIIELKAHESILAKLPDITREQFEQAEHKYWRERLLNDARREQLSSGSVTVGTLSSLEQTGLKIGRNMQGQISYEEDKENDILRIS
jgi:hypothetical protein